MEDNKKAEESVRENLSEKNIDKEKEAVKTETIKDKTVNEEKAENTVPENKDSEKEKVENKTAEKESEDSKNDSQANANDELEKTKAKADEYIDKYQRLMAEFYNFRDRTTKEKAGMYNDGLRDTVEKILPVVDNLERAVNAQRDKATDDDAFFKGVDMILKQFKEILNGIGVEEIPAVGEKFDPKLHSAVSHIEDENFGENTVSIEMQKGYKMGEKVIRHSMVQVAN
ncbi:MAG: nucleotide exchange factor GrpE [Clostridia bacterium]|jgi:molecular chaperone GrpE|nr:nucleotide exchange factor GrpE [Clostridia bacterium]